MRIVLATGVLVVLALGLGVSFDSRRKEIAAERASIRAAWAQVDTALQARADLLPNLLEALRASQKRAALDGVAQAQVALNAARTPAARIAANERLNALLSRLLATYEADPSLESYTSFLRLQDQLADAESHIATEARAYNELVRSYNTHIQLFPNTIVASLAGFHREETYFPLTEAARRASAKQIID